MIKEQKKSLRKHILEKRDALSGNYLSESSKIILNKLLLDEHFLNSRLILCYKSFGSEIITDDIFRYCFEIGKNIAVPFCNGDLLEFRIVKSENDFTAGKFGIITAVDNCLTVDDFSGSVCITPALAVDRRLFRLGYGGGFYDRFLNAHKEVFSIGVCLSGFIIDELPVDSHDIRLNSCITENITSGGVNDGRR